MNAEVLSVLTPAQRAVAEKVVAEEESRRRHLVVSLSGAHAYGFPSPDSDLDLKAIHMESAAHFLGFPRSPTTSERLEWVAGVEIDYSSNELGHALLGVLKGNGNFIERFLSGFAVSASPLLQELQPLVRAALSRRVHRHYAGFAAQQRAEFEKAGSTSTKKLLYVFRTTLTGAQLLRTGEVVTDVTRLLDAYGFGAARALVEHKKRGERSELPLDEAARWGGAIREAFAVLDESLSRSVLPEEPTSSAALEAWLVAQRLSTAHSS
jgi:uncharacterized protein